MQAPGGHRRGGLRSSAEAGAPAPDAEVLVGAEASLAAAGAQVASDGRSDGRRASGAAWVHRDQDQEMTAAISGERKGGRKK
jgi:hypothetical protein